VPENRGGNETRGLPAKGGADLDARRRIEHRVERVIPEDRQRLPARATNEGELEAGFCQHLRQLADTSRHGVRSCSF
jgi:hypothetical protein